MDASRLSAAAQIADDAAVVPMCTDPGFVDAMLDICSRREVGLIVPTIDTELGVYAAHRSVLAAAGVVVAVSGKWAVDMAAEKIRCHAWLADNGLPTVATTTLEDALRDRRRWALPLVIKPARGSSSIGVSVATTEVEVERRATEPELIVQELAPGREYTADAWADRTGRCRCVVLRRRLEVRAGEVSKGVTVHWPEIEELVAGLVSALPEAYGAVTVQLFVEDGQAQSLPASSRSIRDTAAATHCRGRLGRISPFGRWRNCSGSPRQPRAAIGGAASSCCAMTMPSSSTPKTSGYDCRRGH